MKYNIFQKFNFGKYHGIEVGMVYMLAPSYINWMLERTAHCIEDLGYLTSLKVIDRFGVSGRLANHLEIDKEEINELSQMIFNNLLKLKIPYEKQCFMIEQKRLEMVKNLWDLKNLPYQSDNDLVDIISTVISDNKPKENLYEHIR